MTLEVPSVVTLADGTIAQVKSVTASLTEGHISQIVYTVEKASGAWAQVTGEEAHPARGCAEPGDQP